MTTTSDLARLLMMQGTQVPDAGLGPVTNTTRAGRPNPMLTAPPNQERPADYMHPVAELLSLPMGAYGAGQLVGSGINAAREGDYASGAGQVALGMAGMLPMAPKGGKGIRAFHGSPHDFERFDMSKIGTGEGAQAYGHGLYFAEAEGTAQSYKTALAGKGLDPKDVAARHNLPESVSADLYGAINHGKDDPIEAAKAVQMANPALRDDGPITSVGPKRRQIAQAIEDGRKLAKGHMYEVNIKADPNDFLDWDKPLSQQSEKVRAALKSAAPDYLERVQPFDQLGDIPANEAFLRLYRTTGKDAQIGASEALREAGIPGIRYLDQMSRDFTPPKIKETADGFEVYWGNDPRPVDTFKTRAQAEEVARQFDTRSSNYVVFDDNLIEILRKYGLLGPVAGGGTLAGMLMGGQDGETY